MSRLDELIEELCPDGVEYKELNEIAHYAKKRIDVTEVDENTYVGVENLLQNKGGKTIATNVPANGKVIRFEKGDILIGNIRPYLKKIWLADCIGGTNGDVLTVQIDNQAEMTSEFLYYILSSEKFFAYDTQNSKGAKMPRGSKVAVMKYRVPVPPLEVQREIVHILDSFTLLTAELTAELTARKKQYDFYRDKLLTFESDIPLLPIKEVVKKSCAGATPAKGNSEYYEGGTIPWIRTQDVRFNEIREVDSFITEKAVEETAAKWIPENCVIVAISGATAGRCAINKIKATTNQHCLNMQIDAEKALYKYVYYCICSKQDELISKKQGARGDLNSSLILGTKIPVPKLEIQKKIVHVLDNFDAICTDLNIGLPAEIEARQKQYEYYRDLLLTFAETGNMLETDRQTDRQTAIKLIQYVFGYVTVPVEDVVTVNRGKRVVRNQLVNGGLYPVFQNSMTPLGYYGEFNCFSDTTFIIAAGAAGEIGYSRTAFWAADDCYYFDCSEMLLSRYLYYVFKSEQQYITSRVRKASIPRLSRETMEKMMISIPPISEQEHIISILDRFDTLCNDLSAGLPAEIEARQKQYEYYRDKLLSFKGAD